MCTAIHPAAQFTASSPYVPILYEFDVVFNDALGTYPFQHRYLDQGENGWATINSVKTKLRFVGSTGEPVPRPIRLGGGGIPITSINPGIKVGEQKATAVAPPSAVDFYHSLNTSAVAFFIWYKRCKEVNLVALGL
jgi:hypothetical protein